MLQNTRNIDLLVSIILLHGGHNSRDEIVGRAFENEIFKIFIIPTKKLRARNASKKPVRFCVGKHKGCFVVLFIFSQ